jgi:hypothetical protein
MMKKILLGLMFLVLLNETTLANATPTNPNLSLSNSGNISSAVFGGTTSSLGSFMDTFSFTAPTATANYDVAVNINSYSANLTFNPFTLTDSSGTTIATGSFSPTFAGQQASSINLVSGLIYSLNINGNNANGSSGTYSGVLTLSPPVPEPSEWLLMLMGFGLAGFVAGRLKKDTSNIFMAA